MGNSQPNTPVNGAGEPADSSARKREQVAGFRVAAREDCVDKKQRRQSGGGGKQSKKLVKHGKLSTNIAAGSNNKSKAGKGTKSGGGGSSSSGQLGDTAQVGHENSNQIHQTTGLIGKSQRLELEASSGNERRTKTNSHVNHAQAATDSASSRKRRNQVSSVASTSALPSLVAKRTTSRGRLETSAELDGKAAAAGDEIRAKSGSAADAGQNLGSNFYNKNNKREYEADEKSSLSQQHPVKSESEPEQGRDHGAKWSPLPLDGFAISEDGLLEDSDQSLEDKEEDGGIGLPELKSRKRLDRASSRLSLENATKAASRNSRETSQPGAVLNRSSSAYVTMIPCSSPGSSFPAVTASVSNRTTPQMMSYVGSSGVGGPIGSTNSLALQRLHYVSPEDQRQRIRNWLESQPAIEKSLEGEREQEQWSVKKDKLERLDSGSGERLSVVASEIIERDQSASALPPVALLASSTSFSTSAGGEEQKDVATTKMTATPSPLVDKEGNKSELVSVELEAKVLKLENFQAVEAAKLVEVSGQVGGQMTFGSPEETEVFRLASSLSGNSRRAGQVTSYKTELQELATATSSTPGLEEYGSGGDCKGVVRFESPDGEAMDEVGIQREAPSQSAEIVPASSSAGDTDAPDIEEMVEEESCRREELAPGEEQSKTDRRETEVDVMKANAGEEAQVMSGHFKAKRHTGMKAMSNLKSVDTCSLCQYLDSIQTMSKHQGDDQKSLDNNKSNSRQAAKLESMGEQFGGEGDGRPEEGEEARETRRCCDERIGRHAGAKGEEADMVSPWNDIWSPDEAAAAAKRDECSYECDSDLVIRRMDMEKEELASCDGANSNDITDDYDQLEDGDSKSVYTDQITHASSAHSKLCFDHTNLPKTSLFGREGEDLTIKTAAGGGADDDEKKVATSKAESVNKDKFESCSKAPAKGQERARLFKVMRGSSLDANCKQQLNKSRLARVKKVNSKPCLSSQQRNGGSTSRLIVINSSDVSYTIQVTTQTQPNQNQNYGAQQSCSSKTICQSLVSNDDYDDDKSATKLATFQCEATKSNNDELTAASKGSQLVEDLAGVAGKGEQLVELGGAPRVSGADDSFKRFLVKKTHPSNHRKNNCQRTLIRRQQQQVGVVLNRQISASSENSAQLSSYNCSQESNSNNNNKQHRPTSARRLSQLNSATDDDEQSIGSIECKQALQVRGKPAKFTGEIAPLRGEQNLEGPRPGESDTGKGGLQKAARNLLHFAGSSLDRNLAGPIIDSDQRQEMATIKVNRAPGPRVDSSALIVDEASRSCNVAAKRLRELVAHLEHGSVPQSVLHQTLEYAASVLDSVTMDQISRVSDEEDGDLSEVQSDAVPNEVRKWLETTFTRNSISQKRKSEDKLKFRSVANAIRAGIVVDRIYRRMSASTPYVSAEVSNLLKSIDDWSFDCFSVNQVSNGQVLKSVGYELFNRYGLLYKFKIPTTVLKNFLTQIESGYVKHKNPYHNNLHAADVTQTVHYMLWQAGLTSWLTDLEIFATLLAAIIHDYLHTGTTNNFHVMSQSDTALMYNDRAVLENFHICQAFTLMRNDDCNILAGLSKDEYREFRSLVIDMVLATDMSSHFQQIKAMKNILNHTENFSADKSKILSLVIHISDISHPAKEWELHSNWTQLLMEEFFRQGDREKELDLECSPLCDRETTLVPESQLGFIEFIVSPSLEVCGDVLDRVHHQMAEANARPVLPASAKAVSIAASSSAANKLQLRPAEPEKVVGSVSSSSSTASSNSGNNGTAVGQQQQQQQQSSLSSSFVSPETLTSNLRKMIVSSSATIGRKLNISSSYSAAKDAKSGQLANSLTGSNSANRPQLPPKGANVIAAAANISPRPQQASAAAAAIAAADDKAATDFEARQANYKHPVIQYESARPKSSSSSMAPGGKRFADSDEDDNERVSCGGLSADNSTAGGNYLDANLDSDRSSSSCAPADQTSPQAPSSALLQSTITKRPNSCSALATCGQTSRSAPQSQPLKIQRPWIACLERNKKMWHERAQTDAQARELKEKIKQPLQQIEAPSASPSGES